jgi:hypothetical protein
VQPVEEKMITNLNSQPVIEVINIMKRFRESGSETHLEGKGDGKVRLILEHPNLKCGISAGGKNG